LTMARRGKKPEEHVNHERWLITYADLITLLLVFFIIMYAMSKIDTAKYEVLAQTLNLQFNKADSVMPQNNGVTGQFAPPKQGEGGTENSPQDMDKKHQEENEQEKKEKELQDLLKQINTYIQEQNLGTQVSATDTARGVAITLNDLFLFDLGKADLKPASLPILQTLSSLFPTLNATISIEGHTDNLPLATGNPLRDNWGLSSARALSVLHYFRFTAGLDDRKFLAVAHSDTRPIANNDTEENRSKNRRVEIIVLRDSITETQIDPASP
jgi:chemotaxis protein MotB